jgi:hypothetical protein
MPTALDNGRRKKLLRAVVGSAARAEALAAGYSVGNFVCSGGTPKGS